MKTSIDDLLMLFSQGLEGIDKQEDKEKYYCTLSFIKNKNLPDVFPANNILNARDSIEIKFKEDDDEEFFDDGYSSKEDNWTEFVSQYNNIAKGKNIDVEVKILKELVNHTLSVYDMSSFTDYLITKTASQLLHILDNIFNDYLVIEVQSSYQSWHTKSIFFKDRDDTLNEFNDNINKRAFILKDQSTVCNVPTPIKNIIPEDLANDNVNQRNDLQVCIQKCCNLLSLIYLANNSILSSDRFHYEILGTKNIASDFSLAQIKDQNITAENNLAPIVSWVYSDHKYIDKINITRNILSFNLDENTLAIPQSLTKTILSNYQIYQIKDVEQYITLRNNISNVLLKEQEHVDTIVNSYLSEFKKNIFAVGSFILMSIIVRIIAKPDLLTIPNYVIYISIGLLCGSLAYLIYSRSVTTQRINTYRRQYNNIKELYQPLLERNELNEVFDKDNPDLSENNKSIIESKTCSITCTWAAIDIVLIIAFVIVRIFA